MGKVLLSYQGNCSTSMWDANRSAKDVTILVADNAATVIQTSS
ncbi:hypothetical protein [Arthrobacter sp. HY1533]|nr:hypothetical protein [Arthrobacter sp. HY1533]